MSEFADDFTYTDGYMAEDCCSLCLGEMKVSKKGNKYCGNLCWTK